MNTVLPNVVPAIPEIWVMVMACVVLLLGVFRQQNRDLTYYAVQLTLVVAAVLTWFTYHHWDLNQAVLTFHDSFVLDRLAVVLKYVIYIAAFMAFLYARYYNQERHIPNTQYYVLGLLSVLGMMVTVSAHNFLVLYLGLELMSLPIYAMVALQRTALRAIEAAMKYFVMGALASGLLLYGISMVFGATQSLDITEVAQAIVQNPVSQQAILLLGVVFIVSGLGFKLGAAPFHMWVPDVYDGSPTSATIFLSSAPKLAAFGLLIRFLVGALPHLQSVWHEMFIVMALLSIAVGNLVAIVQTNIKRMLAYSSIAHMGYMLLGLLCLTPRGNAAALFYMITYTLTGLGAFGMVALLSRAGIEADELKNFAGLSQRNPWLAFMMLIVLFSMAGIPPLVGFIAKVGVLEALIQVHLVWVATVAIIFAVIGAYYYIRVIKIMYFGDSTEDVSAQPVLCPIDSRVLISANGLAVLLLGIFPGVLFGLCHKVFF